MKPLHAVIVGGLLLVAAWGHQTLKEADPHTTFVATSLSSHPTVGASRVARPAPMTGTPPDFVHAAQSSVNAVVHVQTTSVFPEANNPWLSMLGLPNGRIAEGSGSGVIVDESGVIVTNHHVIEGAQKIMVSTAHGTRHEAELIGSDPSTDLAILKIQPRERLTALEFGNSDETQVGEWVLAVGNPFNLTSTVTAGIVSAKGRNIQLLKGDASREIFPVESFIQTDAAVNPGNSGGALVNIRGELVGINTAIASRTGSYAGYSFAIPSSIVQKVVRDLEEFGRVQRAFLGVKLDPGSPNLRIAESTANGAAERAGLKAGDEILGLEGKQVQSFPELQEALSKHRPGDVVDVDIQRNGQQLRRAVKLGGWSRPVERIDLSDTPWNAKFEPLASDDLEELGLRQGIQITGIRQSLLRGSGIRDGFVVTRIDGRPVGTMADVNEALAAAVKSGDRGVLIEGVYPSGEHGYYGVSLTPN